jgi:hypothetical protein
MDFLLTYWSFIIPAIVCLALLVLHFYVHGTGKLVVRIAIFGIVLLTAQSYLQGKWSERWEQRSVSGELEAFALRMNDIPTSFGDWDSVDSPISQRELDASGSLKCYSRRFTNRNDPTKIVDIFLVCGYPREVCMHTPDQCYVLSGFEEAEDPQSYYIDLGGKAKNEAWFSTNRFRKTMSILPQDLRIFWSFSSDGQWVSPTIPKLSLSHFPAIYKLYANTGVHGDSGVRPDNSAAVPFLREFLPILNSALFPPKMEGADGKTPATDASAGSAKPVSNSSTSSSTAPAAETKPAN